MKVELYTVKLSPYGKKVELMLDMKGIEFTRSMPERGWVREGGYGEINPIRKLPALVIDGAVVPEAEVICEFIEETWPEPALLPADPHERARVRLLSRVVDLYVMSPIIDILNNAAAEGAVSVSQAAQAKVVNGLEWLEHWISPGPYATGEQCSMADCAIAPVLFFLTEVYPHTGLVALPDIGPGTAQYFAAIKSDQHVSAALARMDEGRRERFG